MIITNAQYTTDNEGNNTMIKCNIDGVDMHVPISTGNRHYKEIMRQVDAGEITIADADPIIVE